MTMVRVQRIRNHARTEIGPRIQALENQAVYPLGDDQFQIDHGKDYFAFFDRLGPNVCYVAMLGDTIAAVGCGVLRRLPVGRQTKRCWYACDLKVEPAFRGRHIPLRMLGKAFLPNYLRCPRGYGISMNPPGRAPNRVVGILERFRWARIDVGGTLELFSLDADQMMRAAPLVEARRGPLSYLSLTGVKDIILQSTGRAMPLLHVQFGPCAAGGVFEPVADHVHMLCAPAGDELCRDLHAAGFAPNATATIIHHRMARADWRFVLTSDI